MKNFSVGLIRTFFYKNILICKEDYDTKRVMECKKHKLESKFTNDDQSIRYCEYESEMDCVVCD